MLLRHLHRTFAMTMPLLALAMTACQTGNTALPPPLAEADAFTLIAEGKPVATIVLPEVTEFDRYVDMSAEEVDAFLRNRFPNAGEAHLTELRAAYAKHRAAEAKRVGDEEELAATELQAILRQITGAELPIVRLAPGAELPAGPKVLLGTELARAAGHGELLAALDRDGILLIARQDALVLAGSRARGTLFAVYDFLESLGCRWVMPGPFGEIYPATATVRTTVSKLENPSHSQRYWWCTYGNGKEYPQWTLRNKGTFVRALGDQSIAQGHALSQPLIWGARQPQYADVTHTITVNKPQSVMEDGKRVIKRMDVEEPVLADEYYALVHGKPHRGTPNMSNPKVWALYADYYRTVFGKTRPFDDYVSISAEDGLVLDDRPESRALDSNEFDQTVGAYTATDRLWFFHNRFIEQVRETYPDRKYGVLVYANNMTPPRIQTVNPNMALIFAPLGICPLHHVRDPKCKTNRLYHQWYVAWMQQAKAAGAETYYYDYDPLGFQWNHLMINPQWAIIGRNYPWFHELGLDGHTTQGHDDWGSSGLSHWVMMRLYWNIDQDYREIVRDYCRIRFGAAAEDVFAYYDVYEQRMDVVPDLCSNEIWGNHLALDAPTRAAARQHLERAAKLDLDERSRAQLDTVIAIQRSTDIICDAIDHARETGDFAGAAKRMEPAFVIRDDLNQLYSHFVQPHRTSRDTKTPYLTGGWLNKYLDWAALIDGSAAHVALPRTMHILLDTDNVAAAKGLHLPGAKLDGLAEGDSTLIPDVTYQTQREPAAFFYRTEVDVPAAFGKATRTELYFPSLIARTLQVWINGQPVSFPHENYTDTIWQGPLYFWVNYNHQLRVDISGMLKPGERNTIAFRVFKSFDHGGTYDRVFLLADPPAAVQ